MLPGAQCGEVLWRGMADSSQLAVYQYAARWVQTVGQSLPLGLAWSHRSEDGSALEYHTFTNNKVWLAQWGLSHWGQRVKVRAGFGKPVYVEEMERACQSLAY